jgi:flavin-dependent dehydrogenase
MKKTHGADFDVVVLGGGLVGAALSLALVRRGVKVCVLEARAPGQPQKVVVGEAVTEGTSLYMRHELGLGAWFEKNAYRKFGFDFFTLPEGGAASLEDCHELLLSQAPLEKIPRAYGKLIPTYHVERPALNDHVAELSRAAGAEWRTGCAVERVELGAGEAPHVVSYARDGELSSVSARWVVDASGRKCVLGRQLGIHRRQPEPTTSAVWNRFENVTTDPALWTTFHAIDRRRHTIHLTGHGYWWWWIHQNDGSTSVGVTWDKTICSPDVKAEDHGFAEMAAKFPPLAALLDGARAKEPYQYYAHLPYRSDHWVSERRYALLGDAAWFTDALYSVGLETATRQAVMLTRAVEHDLAGMSIPVEEYADWNRQFDFLCRAVPKLNHFKYRHGWHDPYVVAQTVLYETAEIGPLYQLERKQDWTWDKQRLHYGLQFGSQERMDRLDRFLAESLVHDSPRPRAPLLKKGLLPGPVIYRVTWPLWNLPGQVHWFFRLIRAWGFAERLSQRTAWWPDWLSFMARGPRVFLPRPPASVENHEQPVRRRASV